MDTKDNAVLLDLDTWFTKVRYITNRSQCPLIYRIDAESKYDGRYAISVSPNTLPHIIVGQTEWECHKLLIFLFGNEQHKNWFPLLHDKSRQYTTCIGCGAYYTLRKTIHGLVHVCDTCREQMAYLTGTETSTQHYTVSIDDNLGLFSGLSIDSALATAMKHFAVDEATMAKVIRADGVIFEYRGITLKNDQVSYNFRN